MIDSNIKDCGTIRRKSTVLILKHLETYPFGLFKLKLNRQIEIMIKEEIFELGDFIEAFAKTPSFLSHYDRAFLKYEKTCGAKVVTFSSLWSGLDILYDDKVNNEKNE